MHFLYEKRANIREGACDGRASFYRHALSAEKYEFEDKKQEVLHVYKKKSLAACT